MTNPKEVDVLVVGAGPAGLSAATELQRQGVGSVLVVEREQAPGGIPRHCYHAGFGLRDLHRFMSGPGYATALSVRARKSGVNILLSTTVTDLFDDGVVRLVGLEGVREVRARAVLIATGARERPRAARLIPGDRPAGVFTTGQLQQWTYLKKLPVGHRAVIVGAEHVSFSAVLTLRHAGVETVGIVTDLPRHQSVLAFAFGTRLVYGVPIWTGTKIAAIVGKGRVREVILEDVATAQQRTMSVDTVVFSGDWIPDNELARRGGVAIDRGTLGPASDFGGRTNRRGVYAAGNLIHPVETADIAAIGGRRIAMEIAADLRHGEHSNGVEQGTLALQLLTQRPLAWVWPNRIEPSRGPTKLSMRVSEFQQRPWLTVSQDGRIIEYRRLGRLTPNRSLHIPGAFTSQASPDGGPLQLFFGE